MVGVKHTDRLILGHMPLVGISYQSREKDAEYRRRFSYAKAMREVVDAAVELGVTKFAAASPDSSPLAPLHIHILETLAGENLDIEIIPCIGIPVRIGGRSVDAFRRWATYLAFEEGESPEVRRRILDDPILNFREGWKHRLPDSRPYDEADFRALTVDWEMFEDGLEAFMELPVSYMEPGSETDFLAMTGRLDLLGELVDRIKERGFGGVLFGVHHAGMTIPRLDEELDSFDGYLTPLNPLEVMMFPSKASAERAVRSTKRSVFAIKPLAGGRVKPEEAFRYVFGFDVEGCMIGCASASEVERNIEAAVWAQRAM
jgi:hypothetical protein